MKEEGRRGGRRGLGLDSPTLDGGGLDELASLMPFPGVKDCEVEVGGVG